MRQVYYDVCVPKKPMSIRIDPELHERIARLAAARKWTPSFWVSEALERQAADEERAMQVPDPAHRVKDGRYPREVVADGMSRAAEARTAIAAGDVPEVVAVLAMPKGSRYDVSIPAYGKSGTARSKKEEVEDVAYSLLSDEPGAFVVNVRWG